MKKGLLVSVIIVALVTQVYAQGDKYVGQEGTAREWRKGYFNLGYSSTTFQSPAWENTVNTSYAGALTWGHTFYLHKPFARGSMRFGIDLSWLDLTYSNIKIKGKEFYDGGKEDQHHMVDIALHVGPSLTVVAGEKFKIFGYFRYAPTYAMYYVANEKDLFGNYATMFVGGGSISYGLIGIGAEARFGQTTYKPIKAEDCDAWDAKMNGWRAYITLKFK